MKNYINQNRLATLDKRSFDIRRSIINQINQLSSIYKEELIRRNELDEQKEITNQDYVLETINCSIKQFSSALEAVAGCHERIRLNLMENLSAKVI